MRAYVRFGLADGTARDLGHGDLVGRLWSAALPIDDPRVSEAHALVSLRGGVLKLLALRGRFALAGQPLSELALAVGQRIELADGLYITTLEVEVPEVVMALEGDGLPRQVLPAVASLVVGPRLELLAGFRPDADAVVWSDGRGWRARVKGGADRALVAGDALAFGARSVRAVEVALEGGGPAVTIESGLGEPLHIVARYDTVHIQRGAEPLVVIDGMSARIIGELAAMGVPAPWDVIARELWPEDDHPSLLRKRWDVAIWRLRKKLREARIRTDLVRADRSGNVEICLGRGDTLESQV